MEGKIKKMTNKKFLKNGFTLIELIVVVTIIAVISVAGVISYGSAGKKSRDSRRMSDLEKMRMALEMARQVGTTYPTSIYSLEPNFLEKVPIDPKGSNYYYQIVGANNYRYTIWATMEDLGSTNGIYGAGDAYNYQVTNP